MIISKIKEHIQRISGLTDDAHISGALQLAGEEVWNSADLPGTMQEVRVATDGERYVVLPWQVYKIRGVKNAMDRNNVELYTIQPAYHPMEYFQSEWECRILRQVPIQNRITNATPITFRLRRVQAFDVQITIVGECALASRVSEPVTIPAGTREVTTVEQYVGIPSSIVKNRTTDCNIDIKDADGRVLGVFPNHLLECVYQLAQMRDRCQTPTPPYGSCFDVLFKPHMPNLTDDADVFPPPFHQTVIYKTLEQLKLPGGAEGLEEAGAYNTKALSVTNQFSENDSVGKIYKKNVQPNRFTTRYCGNI